MNSGTDIIEQVIYEYPSLKAAYRELKVTRTPPINGIRTSATNERSDPTANAAIRELPPDEQRRYLAVRKAVSKTHRYQDSQARLTMIDLIYWKRTHSIDEAAIEHSPRRVGSALSKKTPGSHGLNWLCSLGAE